MITGSFVQNRVIDFDSKYQLPPINQFQKINTTKSLSRQFYPKKIMQSSYFYGYEADKISPEKNSEENRINAFVRVEHLERCIKFMQWQHHDVLTSLHKEVELLKKKNNELSVKCTMENGDQLIQNNSTSCKDSNSNINIITNASPTHENNEMKQKLAESRSMIDEQRNTISILQNENKQIKSMINKLTENNTSDSLRVCDRCGLDFNENSVVTANYDTVLKNLLQLNTKLKREIDVYKCQNIKEHHQNVAHNHFVINPDYKCDGLEPRNSHSSHMKTEKHVKLPPLTAATTKKQENSKKLRILQARFSRFVGHAGHTAASGK